MPLGNHGSCIHQNKYPVQDNEYPTTMTYVSLRELAIYLRPSSWYQNNIFLYKGRLFASQHYTLSAKKLAKLR